MWLQTRSSLNDSPSLVWFPILEKKRRKEILKIYDRGTG